MSPMKATMKEMGIKQGSFVVVAQLVEQSLSIPEVQGSTPVIGKILLRILFIINCIEKTKINKKKPGMAHFKKKNYGG